jgi:hypothetical protein
MLTIKKQIILTHSADDWQLYTLANPRGCGTAAEALNRALMEAVNSGKTHSEVVSAVMPVFEEYSDLGACDSEPMGMLDTVLDQVFAEPRW